MSASWGSRRGGDDADPVVVVPERPGHLVRVDVPSGRSPDELDELIDELLPDTDEGPGWFDVALLIIGAGLIGWAVVGGGPTIVLVLGVIALGLGCILPARSLWRRVQRRRRARSRSVALGKGLPLQVSDPAVERLVRAYDDLVSLATMPEGRSAVAAAHSALVEVASLLHGRPAESAAEQEYAENRAAAVEQLAEALREHQADPPDPETLLLARAELDPIGGFNSLTRIGDLTADLRTRRAGE
jgi:hypothetical protein